MIELWKDVDGYEGEYRVSTLGRVYSYDRLSRQNHFIKGKYITPNKLRTGYLMVRLYGKRGFKTITLHRLVAQTFIPNPDNLPEVNHKDENKANNCVDNLEWCTSKYNKHYGTCTQRRSNALKGRKHPVDVNKKISQAMKKHIAMRKANGTYWK